MSEVVYGCGRCGSEHPNFDKLQEHMRSCEVVLGPCIPCGKMQYDVVCQECRPKHPELRNMSFERIIEHFLQEATRA